jgi:hypothetical protein
LGYFFIGIDKITLWHLLLLMVNEFDTLIHWFTKDYTGSALYGGLLQDEGRQRETMEVHWDTLRMSSGCGLVGCDTV